jgi:hypothetical protein
MACHVNFFASVVMNARLVIMGKAGRNLLGKLYVVVVFFSSFNTLCMLHLMLVIRNFIFGYKGEVEKRRYYVMRNCNLCPCGWACCPHTEKSL